MSKEGYKGNEIRTLADLAKVLDTANRPVLLLEGVRDLPPEHRPKVVALGRLLANRFPRVMFRSGNAEGTDTAFAEGVCAVDPARMEYVVTHEGMGKKRRQPGARATALTQLSSLARDRLGDFTVAASPEAERLVRIYREHGSNTRLGAKAPYLLRDTLKVKGAPELGLAPATVGVFYMNMTDPFSGGTGHTVRACMLTGIPYANQMQWWTWDREADPQPPRKNSPG